MLSTMEEKGRTNARQEAMDIFESHMAKDWDKGLEPLGLQTFGDDVVDRDGEQRGGSLAPSQPQSPHVFYARALLVTGRKHGGGVEV